MSVKTNQGFTSGNLIKKKRLELRYKKWCILDEARTYFEKKVESGQ